MHLAGIQSLRLVFQWDGAGDEDVVQSVMQWYRFDPVFCTKFTQSGTLL